MDNPNKSRKPPEHVRRKHQKYESCTQSPNTMHYDSPTFEFNSSPSQYKQLISSFNNHMEMSNRSGSER